MTTLNTSWQLLAHVGGGHFIFSDGHGNIAIADESMRNIKNPASSDDGLLLLNKEWEVRVDSASIYIPVINRKKERVYVTESTKVAWMVIPLLKSVGAEVRLQHGFDRNVRALASCLPKEEA